MVSGESASAGQQKAALRGGCGCTFAFLQKNLQFAPEKYGSGLQPGEERDVSRISAFFKPPKGLSSHKATLYQRLASEINCTDRTDHARSAFLFWMYVMTEQQREALKRVLAEQTERHMVSREEARAFLIKTGTYTQAGELAPEFGGPGSSEPSKGN